MLAVALPRGTRFADTYAVKLDSWLCGEVETIPDKNRRAAVPPSLRWRGIRSQARYPLAIVKFGET